MTGGRRAYPAVLFLLLLAGALSGFVARADPAISNEGGGIHRATWDFSNGANYTVTNVSLAPGNATLAATTGSQQWSGETDFSNWQQTLVNTAVNASGVPLGWGLGSAVAFVAVVPAVLAYAQAEAAADPMALRVQLAWPVEEFVGQIEAEELVVLSAVVAVVADQHQVGAIEAALAAEPLDRLADQAVGAGDGPPHVAELPAAAGRMVALIVGFG